jgi:hypothetical protein
METLWKEKTIEEIKRQQSQTNNIINGEKKLAKPIDKKMKRKKAKTKKQ